MLTCNPGEIVSHRYDKADLDEVSVSSCYRDCHPLTVLSEQERRYISLLADAVGAVYHAGHLLEIRYTSLFSPLIDDRGLFLDTILQNPLEDQGQL